MAVDGTSIKSDIDNNLANKGYRGIRIVNVITALKNVVDWVTIAANNAFYTFLRLGDSVPGGANTDGVYHVGKLVIGRNYDDGSNALFQASSASFPLLNGSPASPIFTVTNPTETNLPYIRNYLFAELPATSGGSLDFIHFTLVAKPWDNTSGTHLVLTMYAANRGGFKAFHHVVGEQDAVGIVAYTLPDGRTQLYVNSDNAFHSISVKVHQHAQAVLQTSFQYVAAPSGTLVYNTLSYANYKPAMSLGSLFANFTAANGGNAYPPSFSQPGTGQLSIGANLIPGQTDLALINCNYISSGYTFWQLTAAATKVFLASLTNGGYFGVGAMFPSARLHVKDAAGYNQFRMETTYTPTNRYDPNGQVGTMTHDASNMYLKTVNGWAKSPLTLLS